MIGDPWAPQVTRVSPTRAYPGGLVLITGKFFSDIPSDNIVEHGSLATDPDVNPRLPIDGQNDKDLFEKCKDGVLLCKLINSAVPGTISAPA